MNRAIRSTRLYILLLYLGHAGWMFPAGLFLSQQLRVLIHERSSIGLNAGIALNVGLTLLFHIMLMARLCDLAVRAKWPLLPVLTGASLVGVLGIGLGSLALVPLVGLLRINSNHVVWQWLYLASGIVLTAGLVLLPKLRTSAEKFFLLDRSHSANWDARRALAAGFGQALLLVLAVGWINGPLDADGLLSKRLLFLLVGYPVGILLSSLQRFPIRQSGLMVIGWFLAAVFLSVQWAAPGWLWPVVMLGGALGLTHAPARNYLLVSVPPSQRMAALGLLVFVQLFALLLAIILLNFSPPIVWLLASISVTVLGIRLIFRELFEQLVEILIWPLYRIKAFGPGATMMPSRGPMIVLANHSAWFDPLWLAKVLPLRVRPMMTARFYDLPGVRWLMRTVVRTIRVSDPGFRREIPEIQEAIAGIAQGDTIMIFPEGWLRRKDDHSLRRFGQGVHQLLKAYPQTPITVCWIEGGWKSFASYWKGPPTKNKHMDFWRSIRVGISAPEILKPELLADQRATRRYLMQACLHARAFLGLPPLPAPSFVTNGAVEDKEEVEENETDKVTEPQMPSS